MIRKLGYSVQVFRYYGWVVDDGITHPPTVTNLVMAKGVSITDTLWGRYCSQGDTKLGTALLFNIDINGDAYV